jgi:hypothetical protein
MGTTPDRVEYAYERANETIRLNGAPPFSVLGIEDVQAALEKSVTATPTISTSTEPQTPTGMSTDNTYTSPNFGFSICWNPAVWTSPGQGGTSEPGFDSFKLESDTGSLWVSGMRAYDGDAAACLHHQESYYRKVAGISEWRVAVDANGIARTEESKTAAWGVYDNIYTDPEKPGAETIHYRDYIQCVSLGDGESVVVFYTFTEPHIFDEHMASVRAVIGTLDLP